MAKPFKLIKSVFSSLLKPKDIYPPIRPAAAAPAKVIKKKVFLDPTFATVKPPEQRRKEPETTQLVPWGDRRKSDTLFAARPSVLVGFPMTKPKLRADRMDLLYQRSNGKFKIDIVSDPRFGVPFGQDQLFLLAVIDHALRSASRKVEIGSIYKILKELGMSTAGSQYKHIQQMILRVFGSVVTCWYQDGKGITGDKILYFSKVHLEVLKDKYGYDPLEGDYITLSEELFDDFRRHPIPYDMAMLKKLKGSPGAMRLYLWAAPRAFRIPASKGSVFVPFNEIANDLGADAPRRQRRFKESVNRWVQKVSDELTSSVGHKFLIDVQDNGVLLYRQTMVPGAQRMTPTIENKMSAKVKTSTTKKKQHKEFDVDWVLEREVESFDDGELTGLSPQALKYRQAKLSFENQK